MFHFLSGRPPRNNPPSSSLASLHDTVNRGEADSAGEADNRRGEAVNTLALSIALHAKY